MFIKAVIFDFDGVLVESNLVKIDAFKSLFAHRPDKIEDIIKYHIENMGISRFVKFKHISENILNEAYSEEIGAEMGKRFSEIVLGRMLKVPFVAGARRFLANNHKKYRMYVVSGTPEDELLFIVRKRGLEQYFKGIYGSPATKKSIITDILRRSSLESSRTVFIGDAETDREVANECNLRFILRKTSENGSMQNNEGIIMIDDLKKLKTIIEGIRQ